MVKKNKFEDKMLEEDVLSHLLEHSYSTLEATKILRPESFSSELNKQAYLTCVELYNEKGTFNRFDVFRSLKSKELSNSVDASLIISMIPKRSIDLLSVCVELKELESKRYVASLTAKLQERLSDDCEISEIVSLIDNGVSYLTDASATDEVVNIKDVYDTVIAKMESSAGTTKFSGVETGSRKLNYHLGGWQKGITVIAARPSMGKTVVGLDIAKQAAMSGKNVLFLSLEMPKDSLLYRYISSEAFEYNYSDIKANRISPEDVQKIKRSNATMLRKLPIFFYDSDNTDVNYLSMLMSAECRKNNIDIIVIDYLQLMKDNQAKSQDDFTQVSAVMSKIRRITRKLGIPVILLSQLSREVEKRTNRSPQLSDLRSSGNIEQDADVVIGLYRDDYYKYVDAKSNGQAVTPMDNILKYIILKNRDGNVGDVIRYVDVKTNRIADEESELTRFAEPAILYQDSVIKTMKSDFDVTVTPF
jgi:replicative DNA helicase